MSSCVAPQVVDKHSLAGLHVPRQLHRCSSGWGQKKRRARRQAWSNSTIVQRCPFQKERTKGRPGVSSALALQACWERATRTTQPDATVACPSQTVNRAFVEIDHPFVCYRNGCSCVPLPIAIGAAAWGKPVPRRTCNRDAPSATCLVSRAR